MKHIIVVALILFSAGLVTAEDAPAMWMEQDGNIISLMVNTSTSESGLNARIYFEPARMNITDVDVSMSPWNSMTGPGWSHQGDYVNIALVLFDGVAPGEYQVASMTVDCLVAGSSQVSITNAEPVNVVVSDLAFVCGDVLPPPPVGAVVAVGSGMGVVTVPIMISDAVSAGACDVTLTFDPTIVRVAQTSDGDMDCTYTNLENADAGWVRVGATQGSNSGVDTFTLLNVDLEPVANAGSCELILTVTTLKDDSPEGVVITYTISNGTYTIPPVIINGDADGSGTVDILDGAYIAKHLIGVSGYESIDVDVADVNGDGLLDMADSMYLTKHVMGDQDFATLG